MSSLWVMKRQARFPDLKALTAKNVTNQPSWVDSVRWHQCWPLVLFEQPEVKGNPWYEVVPFLYPPLPRSALATHHYCGQRVDGGLVLPQSVISPCKVATWMRHSCFLLFFHESRLPHAPMRQLWPPTSPPKWLDSSQDRHQQNLFLLGRIAFLTRLLRACGMVRGTWGSCWTHMGAWGNV